MACLTAASHNFAHASLRATGSLGQPGDYKLLEDNLLVGGAPLHYHILVNLATCSGVLYKDFLTAVGLQSSLKDIIAFSDRENTADAEFADLHDGMRNLGNCFRHKRSP